VVIDSQLRQIRQSRGFSVAALARLAGVSSGTIEGAERGAHLPHPSTRHRIARALGLQPEQIWGPVARPNPIVERRAALGVTQLRLAVEADIAPETLRLLERGGRVSIETRDRVAAALDRLEGLYALRRTA
jgi:transcriptional regulator with XRE-family HTH domain